MEPEVAVDSKTALRFIGFATIPIDITVLIPLRSLSRAARSMQPLSYEDRGIAIYDHLASLSLEAFEARFGSAIRMAIDHAENTTARYESRVNLRVRFDDDAGRITRTSDPWRVDPAKFQPNEPNAMAADAIDPGKYNYTLTIPTRSELATTADVKTALLSTLEDRLPVTRSRQAAPA